MNNVITASRLNSLASCARKHFWQYEVGLRKEEVGLALHVGSAWARAMESRWNGGSYDEALAAAIPEGIKLDPYSCATVSALLAGYYDYYGQHENCGRIDPEVQFGPHPIEGSNFVAEGKIDGLGWLKDGREALIECKTTADSIDKASDYWLRLRFNLQVLQYLTESRNLPEPRNPEVAYYDVIRKPSIRPKRITDLDEDGKKIVLDSKGKRVFVEKGKKGAKHKEPQQAGSKEKGWIVKNHLETPDEFADRVWADTKLRPDFYFCRYEIPVLDQQVEEFKWNRLLQVKLITFYRMQESTAQVGWKKDGESERDPEAWPRSVAVDNCRFCQYASFCLQSVTPDLNNPPSGFSIQAFNPELEKEENYDTAAQKDDAAAEAGY